MSNPFYTSMLKVFKSRFRRLRYSWAIVACFTMNVFVAFAVTYASHSVLASGKWKKISVTESGIYRLDYSDIVKMGINPLNVQIYGYGGKLLSEDFSLNDYKDDLPEVAVYKELGADSIFNAGDFILFYAQGPISWSYNSSNAMYLRTRNHYSTKAYYFVGERANGTRTVSTSAFNGLANKVVTSFTDFQLHELENVNMGETVAGTGTGRALFGEDFISNPSRSFVFNVPNADTIGVSKVYTEFAANNQNSTSLYLFVDNTYKNTLYFSPIDAAEDFIYGSQSSTNANFRLKSNSLRIQLDYNYDQRSAKTRAYLNHITLNLRRLLTMTGSTMAFRDPLSVGTGNVCQFQITGASSKLRVFDVTDPTSMLLLSGSLQQNVYRFLDQASTLREYVAVEVGKGIPKPTIEGSITNQNLHGQSGMDMVIVTPSNFKSQAIRLAEAHAINDGLTTLIVTPEQIYNEFSSGTPDATAIRRMMKLYYDNGTISGNKPKNLLLFGDGFFDNIAATKNSLPTYQSVESLNGYNSYVTDDYFGFLDSNEGRFLNLDKLDVGIGRMPVSTIDEARIVVDKTIDYMKNTRMGAWKNRVLFLADNKEIDNYIHEKQADQLATTLSSTHPEFMVNKIYLDTYTPQTSASGTLVPEANFRFSELLNDGLLLLNYTGHGSTTQWSDKKLLLKSDIEKMTNKFLPLWITATCDFTRYDDSKVSAGEMILLKENGGGIALVTTTRVVYSSSNLTMNASFLDNVFKKQMGARLTLGEVMNRAKLSDDLTGDANKLNFALIGDPALRLTYPEYSAKVLTLNEVPVSTVLDTLKALNTVTVSGRVYREDGSWAQDFNGMLVPTVLDAAQIIANFDRGYETISISDRSRVLFSGKDSVINGEFTFSFVMPLDNSYSFKKGQINLYAWDKNGINEAQGLFDGFVIGGTDTTVARNYDGPEMTLYLNQTSFVDGGVVGESPTFIAELFDENGLNTSGNGVGHNLTLVVDGSPAYTYNLNNAYLSDVGSFQSGKVQFQLPKMSIGAHTLTFKAWDVQNNSSMAGLKFVVQQHVKPQISAIQFVQQGNTGIFRFAHDRPIAQVRINVRIYDLMGRIVWEAKWNMKAESSLSDILEWNLTDTNKRRVGNGVYVCKIELIDSNGEETFDAKKILVTGQ